MLSEHIEGLNLEEINEWTFFLVNCIPWPDFAKLKRFCALFTHKTPTLFFICTVFKKNLCFYKFFDKFNLLKPRTRRFKVKKLIQTYRFFVLLFFFKRGFGFFESDTFLFFRCQAFTVLPSFSSLSHSSFCRLILSVFLNRFRWSFNWSSRRFLCFMIWKLLEFYQKSCIFSWCCPLRLISSVLDEYSQSSTNIHVITFRFK